MNALGTEPGRFLTLIVEKVVGPGILIKADLDFASA
jgi:hypothetical protein